MVKPFQPPKHSFEASLVVAELRRVSKKVTPLELEAEDVVAHVTSRLAYTVRFTACIAQDAPCVTCYLMSFILISN